MSAAQSRRLLALDLPPGEAFIDALDAAWQAGDAVLPLGPDTAASRRIVAAMRPHAIVTADGETEYGDPAPVDDVVALVIATSGSTGEPKGAQLSHAALTASAAATASRIGQSSGDHWLSCLPWQHIGGLQVLLRARRGGTQLTVLPRFEPNAVDAAVRAGANLTSLVPTTLLRLLDANVDLRPLKAILLGAAAAPPSLLQAAGDAGANVVTTYGMSETCGGCVYDGWPLDGVLVRIADDGRIEVAGPTLMESYRLRPDLSPLTGDGWLRTNDVGSIDGSGRLTVLGRADDVIVTGGEKVAADRVAGLVAGHPAVRDAAVIGVPDSEWGQRVVAVVELAGDEPLTLETLRDWLGDALPGWSKPRALVVVSELPRLPSGKLDRRALEREV